MLYGNGRGWKLIIVANFRNLEVSALHLLLCSLNAFLVQLEKTRKETHISVDTLRKFLNNSLLFRNLRSVSQQCTSVTKINSMRMGMKMISVGNKNGMRITTWKWEGMEIKNGNKCCMLKNKQMKICHTAPSPPDRATGLYPKIH